MAVDELISMEFEDIGFVDKTSRQGPEVLDFRLGAAEVFADVIEHNRFHTCESRFSDCQLLFVDLKALCYYYMKILAFISTN